MKSPPRPMSRAAAQLLVIAKSPVPGRSKTRLSPPLPPEAAARVAEAALADTLHTVATVRASRRMLILEGATGPWLPRGFEVIPQRGGGLDERLASAFEDAGGPSLLIGMDTPQVAAGLLEDAMGRLMRPGVDAVLGPALDGGWWAIGLRRPDPDAFLGVPMSTRFTAAMQRRRLTRLRLRTVELPALRDVDLIQDALAVASTIPGSRFARSLDGALEAGPQPSGRDATSWSLLGASASAAAPGSGLGMRWHDGHLDPLPVRRWLGSPSPREHEILAELPSPALDVGCGPGRHARALLERGVDAFGVESSPTAARLATRRGVPVLQRSIFDGIPGAGRWGSALLLDGNIGIGGDPPALLRRVRTLLRPGGSAVVEVTSPARCGRMGLACLESGRHRGPWFRWARVELPAIARMATAAGFRLRRLDGGGERWFARLEAR
ncbi:hypothetical protein BH20ACT24_BH20ACT24_21360 [soil metagenome]